MTDINKKKLRKIMLSDRIALLPSDVLTNSKKIINTLKAHFHKNSRFLFYFPVRNEVDLRSFAEEIIEKNKTAAFPSIEQTKSVKNPEMLFRIVKNMKTDFSDLSFNIPQPGQNSDLIIPQKDDVVFVPGLAFDIKGNRLGYGGGFFDRFLKTFPGISVGVCHHFQVKNSMNVLDHDIAVDYICTEQKFINCRSNINEVIKDT